MAPNKGKQRAQPPPQPSDYETDAAFDIPDPPTRSISELNLKVLQRSNPDIVSILHIAHHTELYRLDLDSNEYARAGIAGPLFVSQLSPHPSAPERFSVTVKNRQSFEDFDLEIKGPENVEVGEDDIIHLIGKKKVYSLWVFSEPAPSSTATMRRETREIIQQVAERTHASRLAKQEEGHNENEGVAEVEEEMTEAEIHRGRQVSLRELFGQQREKDADWSVHDHHTHPPPRGPTPIIESTPTPGTTVPQTDVLTQLFMKAKQDYMGQG